MLSGLQMKYSNAMMLYINVIIMCVQLFAIIIGLMYQHLKNLAFCKSTSYIPAKIPQPTSYIPNIPHPQYSTSRTSDIPNILHPEHPTSRTSPIPNIPHPEQTTSPTSHIPNIPHPQHPTSRKYHIPNIPHPQYPTSLTSHTPNITNS